VVPATDLQLACTIAQTYGWRMQSEILMLERRQVDLDAASGMGTLSLDAGSTKNEDARVVVLTPQVKSLVEAQLGRVEAFQKRTGTITPYLFVHTQGEHQGSRIKDFKRTWATACRLAGVPAMLRHDFRRTAVRGMVNAGVPERVAMEISGHRTRSVFDRYHIVSQADHQRAARLLADAQTTQQPRSDMAKNVAK
jgi:integrase